QTVFCVLFILLTLTSCGQEENNYTDELLRVWWNLVQHGQTAQLSFNIENQGQDLVVTEQIKVSPPADDKEQKGPASVIIVSKINKDTKTAHIMMGSRVKKVQLSDEQFAALGKILGTASNAEFNGTLSKEKLKGRMTLSDAQGEVLSKSTFEKSSPAITLYSASL